MSRWSTAYTALLASWEKFKARLKEEGLDDQVDSTSGFELARARKVADYVDSVFEQIDPELAPHQFISTISAALASAESELNTFLGNSNIGHLQNLNNHLDGMIGAVSQTPFTLSAAQKGALTRAATTYSETAEILVKKLSSQVDNSLKDIDSNLAAFKNDVENSKTELQTLQNEIKQGSTNIETHLSQFSSQFQAAEKSRGERFEAVVSKYSEKSDSEFKSLAMKAGKTLGVLSKFQDDAQDVLGVVVNTAQAGAYASYANEEKKSANSYRRGAIALMVISVAVLVAPEIYKITAEQSAYLLDWHRVLGRLPFSLVLFVPAFYLAKESSQHRSNEVLNRRRQLILTTIHPYLELIDSAKAEEIRADVAKGIFSEGTALVEPDESSASNLIAQLSNLVKILAKKS